MDRAKPCRHSTCTKRRSSCACRPPSCACTPVKVASKRPSRASAGSSSKATLLRISVSFTLIDGKRR